MKTTIIDRPLASKERADCTVKAIMICLGLTYEQAHQRLASLGRKSRCRFKIYEHLDALGLEQRPEFACRTLQSILPELRGRFIVRHARHVFAVIDGTPYDWKEVKTNLRTKMVYGQVQNRPQ